MESVALSTVTLDIVKEFPASIQQQEQDSTDLLQANQLNFFFHPRSHEGIV